MSGIPTFRGAGGFWKKWRSTDLATPEAFAKNPRLVWEFYNYRREVVLNCEPNQGHLSLTKLQKRLPKMTVVTQNVDDLHRRAGTQNIIKLHGDLFSTRCVNCKTNSENYDSPIHESFARFENLHDISSTLTSDIKYDGIQPLPEKYCDKCRKTTRIRPDIVWFGENLDRKNITNAQKAVESCDLCFVIGTSSQVYPAAGFSALAKESGATVVEINPFCELTDEGIISIPEKSGIFLPRLTSAFLNSL